MITRSNTLQGKLILTKNPMIMNEKIITGTMVLQTDPQVKFLLFVSGLHSQTLGDTGSNSVKPWLRTNKIYTSNSTILRSRTNTIKAVKYIVTNHTVQKMFYSESSVFLFISNPSTRSNHSGGLRNGARLINNTYAFPTIIVGKEPVTCESVYKGLAGSFQIIQTQKMMKATSIAKHN